jgi:hypothetical protein
MKDNDVDHYGARYAEKYLMIRKLVEGQVDADCDSIFDNLELLAEIKAIAESE